MRPLKFAKHDTGGLLLTSGLDAEGWQYGEFTAIVITTADGRTVLGHGMARRDRSDRPNDDIGQQLALGRALENAGKKIQRRAAGLVKHADDVAADKAKKAAAAAVVKKHGVRKGRK